MQKKVFLESTPYGAGMWVWKAPDRWVKFARQHRVGAVWLVDHPQAVRSVRTVPDNELFINTRGTYWDGMVALFSCRRYTEVVTLRFLHEVAHVHLDHASDPRVRTTSQGIEIIAGSSKADSNEEKAWAWAIRIRNGSPDLFEDLETAFSGWAVSHQFADKDWPETLEEAVRHGWPQKRYLAWPPAPQLVGHVNKLLRGQSAC